MNFLRILFLIVGLVLGPSAHSAPLRPQSEASEAGIRSVDNLKSVPVLENGRLKPLDTFARNLLLRFSAKDTYEGRPAITWVARLLFTPESTRDDKVFIINNPDIATALAIDAETHRRYSFSQLDKNHAKLLELYNAALKIPDKQRSIVEEEIVRVLENLRYYVSLSHEMKFAFPHRDFAVTDPAIVKALGLKGQGTYSFLDIALTADALHTATESLERKDKSAWTDEDKALMGLLNRLFQWSFNYHDLTLTVIPSSKQDQLWLSPWDAIGGDFQDDNSRQAVILWRDMALAYTGGGQVEFDLAARQYLALMGTHVNQGKFFLELLYQSARPFLFSKIFYLFALVFFVISFISPGRIYHYLAWGSIITGFIPHTLALIARIIIMSRPPVSSLYETFIFVAFIAVLLGLLIEMVNKRWLGLVVSGISGTALLFIAGKYSSEGDTLNMLIAVLNSNFWLGTHVLTITMGYGATCVAGVVGHVWLLQKVFKKEEQILAATHQALMGMLALALTLTFLGTNLGGIWADQSWGRFWGWDPKENGALMIVLWCAILFHAKVAGMIGPVGLAVGAVLGMVVVMWAWFGVNLLSIGLHSYGFTSGVANTLAVYVSCEILFLAVIASIIRRQRS